MKSTGKIINITNKLNREPKFIMIDESNYKVDCSKNAVIRFMDINKRVEAGEIDDISSIDESIKIFLGPEAFNKLNDMKLDFDDWKIIFFACVSAAMNKDLEEVEDSFRKAAGTT